MPALSEQRCLFIGVASDLGDVIAALDRDEPRVRAEAAEHLGEPFKFVVGHSLIGEHQHMVLVEGGAQFSGLKPDDKPIARSPWWASRQPQRSLSCCS